MEKYQHDNDEWKCDELEKITFSQLINGITTKERIDSRKRPNPWQEMYLPESRTWNNKNVVRVNTLATSADAIVSRPTQEDQKRSFDKKNNKSYGPGTDRTQASFHSFPPSQYDRLSSP